MNPLFLASCRSLKCILNWKIDRLIQYVTDFERDHSSLLQYQKINKNKTHTHTKKKKKVE